MVELYCEDVYLCAYESPAELRVGLTQTPEFYNTRHCHSALDRRTPDAVYHDLATSEAAWYPWKISPKVLSKIWGALLSSEPD